MLNINNIYSIEQCTDHTKILLMKYPLSRCKPADRDEVLALYTMPLYDFGEYLTKHFVKIGNIYIKSNTIHAFVVTRRYTYCITVYHFITTATDDLINFQSQLPLAMFKFNQLHEYNIISILTHPEDRPVFIYKNNILTIKIRSQKINVIMFESEYKTIKKEIKTY